MININSVTKIFDKKIVLDNLNIKIHSNECIGLIGPSASGKSVLLKCLGQIYNPELGEIKTKLKNEEISSMFQEGALFDSFSALDNVIFPLVGGDVPFTRSNSELKKHLEKAAIDSLAQVGLSAALNKLPGQLSGGMRKRLSLARALVNKPKLALLDDPTSGLDPIASSVIMELIRKVHNENKMTTIIASHDLRRLFSYVDRIIALFNGQVIFDGNLESLKSKKASNLGQFVSARYEL